MDTRRNLITGALASVGSVAAGAKPSEPNFIEQWIVKHGGNCCGSIVSRKANHGYEFICNECGGKVDIMVSEIIFERLGEALQRAQHALTFAHGHIAHDGKPEHSYPLDFSQELRFIDEALTAARIEPKVLEPLK